VRQASSAATISSLAGRRTWR